MQVSITSGCTKCHVIRCNCYLQVLSNSIHYLVKMWAFFSILDLRHFGPSDFWAFNVLDLRHFGLSDLWAFDTLGLRHLGPSVFWAFGFWIFDILGFRKRGPRLFRNNGPSTLWAFGFMGLRSYGSSENCEVAYHCTWSEIGSGHITKVKAQR